MILPGSATITWQAAQTDDPLLATGMRYAVYSRCGNESSYQLVDENIEGLSYTLTSLPAPSQCVLMVVAYHRYCLRDLNGVFIHETLPFITAIAGKKEQENRMTVYYASLTPLFLSFRPAPEKPAPPKITVGVNGFTIDDFGPQDVVVEYVCNYTSVITGLTSQVRMKPSETTDVNTERVGGYMVQVRLWSLLITCSY